MSKKDEILEVINKGVPISTPILIYMKDLLEMTDDKTFLQIKMQKKQEKFFKFLRTMCKKNDIEFFLTLGIVSNPNTLEKTLRFARNGFFSSILFNLNMNNICYDYNPNNVHVISIDMEDDNKEIRKRIELLRNTKRRKELGRNFPLLYDKFLSAEAEYKMILDEYRKIENSNNTELQKVILKNNLKELYNTKFDLEEDKQTFEEIIKDAQEFSVETFCKSYAESFTDFIDHRKEIYDFLDNYEISIKNLGINKEKLELYIASESMKYCYKFPEEDKQKFVYYVSNYFSSDSTRKHNNDIYIEYGNIANKGVTLSDNSKVRVTPASLYEEYRNFLVENPQIKVVNLNNIDFSGMNLKEVEEFVLEYLKDLQANWEIIPEEDDNISIDELRVLNEDDDDDLDDTIPRTNYVDPEKILELYMAKKEFYAKTDPLTRIKGKNTFSGYLGYIFSNGKVVLDRFYKNAETHSLAYGEAIYVLDMADFYRLSQFPKKVLMSDPNVIRIVHDSKWMEKTLNIISGGSDSTATKTVEEIKRLIKIKEIEEEN